MKPNRQSPGTPEHDPAGLMACAIEAAAAVPGAQWRPPTVEELGDFLPGFEIREFLGRGGMGAVFRATQQSLDRSVAIKILPPDLDADPEFAERFAREARTMAKLSHPHVVHVYDFGQHEETGLYYLVMEHVDGSNLHELIARGAVETGEALGIVCQICEALQHAHSQGYVHRDIKPANIFLTADGQVKVGDFGLAKLCRLDEIEALSSLTNAGSAVGTLDYVAPEILRGETEKTDHRADIFSLGVMFYELLTGSRPRGHFAPPSRKIRIDVRVDDVVLKAMDEEPERRYQEARAVKEDVEILGTGRRRPGAGRRSRIVLATGTALAMLLLLVQAGRRGWFARPRGAGAGAPEIATMTLPDEHGRLSLPGATGKVTVSAFDPIVLDRRPGLGLDHDVDVAVVGGGLPRAAYRDGQDRLHFSFPFRGDLSRASHWASFSLEKAGATYRHLSLAVWKGRPILAYETIDGGNLMVAVADSATPLGPSDWKLVTVDSAGDRVGNSNRVHVFSSGVVGISYSDYAHGHLKYAWSADPADAASWRTVVVHRRPEAETVSHFGFRSRLTEVHGFPAILYASFPEDGLYYVRARDPDGSQWEADDIRDLGRPSRQSGWVNQWREGVAVTHHEEESGALFFATCPDPSGAGAWRRHRVNPDGAPGLFYPETLILDEGSPLILAKASARSALYLARPADSENLDAAWDIRLLHESAGEKAIRKIGDNLLVMWHDGAEAEGVIRLAGVDPRTFFAGE